MLLAKLFILWVLFFIFEVVIGAMSGMFSNLRQSRKEGKKVSWEAFVSVLLLLFLAAFELLKYQLAILVH